MTTHKGKLSSADSFMGRSTIYGAEDGQQHTPYMTRLWFGRLRLHIFHRGDDDRDHHDHPWDFWTFPLGTPYLEELSEVVGYRNKDGTQVRSEPGVVSIAASLGVGFTPVYEQRLNVVPAWRWTFRPAEHTHRVIGKVTSRLRLSPMVPTRKRDDQGEIVHGSRPAKIVTLVWRGHVRRKWGFLKNRNNQWCWEPWRDYVFGGGKNAACR